MKVYTVRVYAIDFFFFRETQQTYLNSW